MIIYDTVFGYYAEYRSFMPKNRVENSFKFNKVFFALVIAKWVSMLYNYSQ